MEAQLGTLEKDLAKIETSNRAVPPGFYAHLGLLYAQTGNQSQAIHCFMTEKSLFPEAVVFMNFLLRSHEQ